MLLLVLAAVFAPSLFNLACYVLHTDEVLVPVERLHQELREKLLVLQWNKNTGPFDGRDKWWGVVSQEVGTLKLSFRIPAKVLS